MTHYPNSATFFSIDLPKGTRVVQLPNDDRVRVLAMTATREPFRLWPTTPLYASDLPAQ